MIGAQSDNVGQRRQRNIFWKMLLDVLCDFLLLPACEAAANDVLFSNSAVTVEAQELVHQHDAEGFGVLLLSEPRLLRLRLELHCGFPQILVEKEQPWLEFRIGETQLGIDQRTTRIDIEIGHARQAARLLPAAEPVSGRHEAQFAAE